MLDKIIPLKLSHFLHLIRLSKPIGFMLLMWPCWFALAILPINFYILIKWYLLFFFGAFLMRSAGCIINDLVDIDIDRKIERTSDRVLPSKKLSILESFFFLFILLFLSLVILFQFDFLAVIGGLVSLPIIILYPFMKRFTHWPQIILGVVFSWGVILVSLQFNNYFNINFILLYIACIFWTLAYDTIYAYQDRNEDILNNVKSTAVLFGKNGPTIVKFFYLMFFLIIGYISWEISNNFLSFIVIILYIFVMNLEINKWDPESLESSKYYFKLNNFVGLCSCLFLLIF